MIYVGIDPGMKGGVASYADETGVMAAWPMPLNGKDIDVKAVVDLISADATAKVSVMIEKAQTMPKQGVVSMGSYMLGYGKILGALEVLDWPFVTVQPKVWKNVVLVGTKKDKQAAIDYVRGRYPDIDLKPGNMRNCHDGMADAICLVEYGRSK